MTDNEPEVDTTDNVCLRKKGKRRGRTSRSTTSSSSSNSSASLIYVTMEDVLSASECELIIKNNIAESTRVNSVSSWYLKIKREVLKSLRNKVYPIIVCG
ncbi:hypothetical protein M0804_004184 [Polistes exclamans]|nr:hypothetical protein M0804_004184 [Polistes exclamans]